MRQGPGDGDALLLAAGEVAWLRRSTRSASPTRPSSVAAHAAHGRDPGRPSRAITGSITFSSAVNAGQQVVELEDEADRAAAQARERRRRRARWCPAPSRKMRPLVGRSSRPMRFSSVLLPEPEGPMSAVNSPRSSAEVDPVERRGSRRPRRPYVLARDRPARGSTARAQPWWITWAGSSRRRAGPAPRPRSSPVDQRHDERRPRKSCGVRLTGKVGEPSGLVRHAGEERRRAPAPSPTPSTQPPGPTQPALDEEDPQHLPARGAHGPEDADLRDLLHHPDHQHAGDAERHRDDHEDLDHVARAVLRAEPDEKLLVERHPAVGRQAGARARCPGRSSRRSKISRHPDLDGGDAPGQVEQGLGAAQGDQHPALVHVLVAEVEDAADGEDVAALRRRR